MILVNLHAIMQILSLLVFEKIPLKQLLTQSPHQTPKTPPDN